MFPLTGDESLLTWSCFIDKISRSVERPDFLQLSISGTIQFQTGIETGEDEDPLVFFFFLGRYCLNHLCPQFTVLVLRKNVRELTRGRPRGPETVLLYDLGMS